jgi:hypothetical protein
MAKASESTKRKSKKAKTPSADGDAAPVSKPDADEKVAVGDNTTSAADGATSSSDSAPATPRKRPGKAEPLPMKWKVVGFSDGLGVVLLKAQEKLAANREAARLEEEQKYENIGVYSIDAALPPPPKSARRPEPKTPPKKQAKAAPKTASQRAAKTPTTKKAKPTPKTKAKKTVKRKTAKRTSRPKRKK